MLAADPVNEEKFVNEKRTMLFELLDKAIHRARLLQKAMTRLYVALSTFLATSVALGVVAVTNSAFAPVALILGFIGAGLMFAASVLLILESQIGLASTYTEMDFLWRRGQHHAPAELQQLKKGFWRLFGTSR